jgi:prepilin signal peptidase PulO-like enzyme (type II secretory pathway)
MLGAAINWAAYRLAWNQRRISPWSAAPNGVPPRVWSDRIPIYGWWGLAREVRAHGPRFWLRPLLVELGTGVALAVLYAWETQSAQRLWAPQGMLLPGSEFLTANLVLAEHLRFLSHGLLLALMLAASLIDLDEKTIPDSITVPGTLLGVSLAAIYPWSLLPAAHFTNGVQTLEEFLTVVSPNLWPAGFEGATGVWLALGCWSLWCFALLPRRWNIRRGWGTAVRVFFHRLRAERITYLILIGWIIGAAALALFGPTMPKEHWAALVTALVGLAGGAGVIWAVRLIGTYVLKREAMGFGDVTLMAMIGTFIGWQASLIVFFVAPFFAILFAVANWVSHREREIPYGPFLCLGAMTVIVRWVGFWEATADVFELGWFVPMMIAICLVLMAVMLGGYEFVRRRFERG